MRTTANLGILTKMDHILLPEFLKKAKVVATSRSEINLCEPTERKSRIVYARVGKRQ